jgi:predicted aspartyl protease
MVHRDLVRDEKQLEGEAVTICCAHGDVSLYPLAEVNLEFEGIQMRVKAAVSDSLPVSVLLGTDVPELGRLLRSNPRTVHTTVGEALVV